MSGEEISTDTTESKPNDTVCEGFGCSAKITTKVSVSVGLQGRVSLFLCDTCKTKFSGDKGISSRHNRKHKISTTGSTSPRKQNQFVETSLLKSIQGSTPTDG